MPLIERQIAATATATCRAIVNVGGGVGIGALAGASSAAGAASRLGDHTVEPALDGPPVRHPVDGAGLVARARDLGLDAASRRPRTFWTRSSRTPTRIPTGSTFAPECQHRRACRPSGSPTRRLPPLQKLSVVIPARDEAGCIASTVEHLHLELRLHGVPHEIVVVDDGSRDRDVGDPRSDCRTRMPALAPVQQSRAPRLRPRRRLRARAHDAATPSSIMMADESDDCRDVVRYWRMLNEGWECVFGSRFIAGGGTIDYPRLKLLHEPHGQLRHPRPVRHAAERHHQRLQGLPAHRDRRLPAASSRRTSISRSNCRSRRSCAATRGPSCRSPGATAAPAKPS